MYNKLLLNFIEETYNVYRRMIDKIGKTDFPRLMEIWENAVIATHDFLLDEDFDYYSSQLPKHLSNLSLYGCIGENDEIKGFLGLSEKKIEMLFVDGKYRGKGVGKQLIKFATEVLNIKEVDVNEQNQDALRFYKRAGFSVYSRSEHDSQGKDYPILHMKLG